MHTTRTRRIAVLIASVLAFSILSVKAHAQRRPRLKPPPALLDVIDKDDRDCVTQTGLARSVTVKPIKLARDRTQQLLIRGAGLCLCGAQNCRFWVYGKTGRNYKLLLVGTGATKVKPGRYSAHGYRDVISESHASAAETIVRTYRYDGAQYQPQRCFNRAYYDENGKYTSTPANRPCGDAPKKTETYANVPANLLDLELSTIDNRVLKLSNYAGQIIVVNLFASWCVPCRESLSDLVELTKDAGQVAVIGVTTTVADPQLEPVRNLVTTLNVDFPIVYENLNFSESLSNAVNARSVLPQTFVIDKQNRIRKYFLGYNPAYTSPLLRDVLRKIKAEDAKLPG